MLEIKDYGPYIGDNNYIQDLNETIRPYINQRRCDGDMTSSDGVKLHYVVCKADNEIAAITIFHGKGEFFEKLEELVYTFLKHGYSVFFLEQRGFARSDRLTDKSDMIHVNSYDEYVSDQWEFFWKVVMKQAKSDIKFMYAHSMGGLVGARFMEVHPQCYRAAVLSSPMLALKYNIPEFLVAGLTNLAHWFHKGDRFATGQHGYAPYQYNPLLMQSKPRYEEMYKLREENHPFQTAGVSFDWIRASRICTNEMFDEAEKVCVPVLLCQALKDETVDNLAQHAFCSLARDVMMVQFQEAGHEIYAANEEERNLYFDWLLSFYEDNYRKLKKG